MERKHSLWLGPLRVPPSLIDLLVLLLHLSPSVALMTLMGNPGAEARKLHPRDFPTRSSTNSLTPGTPGSTGSGGGGVESTPSDPSKASSEASEFGTSSLPPPTGTLPLSSPQTASPPRVGRDAAMRYFQKNATPNREVAGGAPLTGDNFLQLHVGTHTRSQAFLWGASGQEDSVAQATYGMTFWLKDLGNVDLHFRGDFSEYVVDAQRLTKLSLIALFSLPRAQTLFPIYFALGLGPGVFFNQLPGQSSLSLDYQLLVGARFFNLFQQVGFFVEYGMKNHVHLLSKGQLNATFVSLGTSFIF